MTFLTMGLVFSVPGEATLLVGDNEGKIFLFEEKRYPASSGDGWSGWCSRTKADSD
jgi:hypothetical protein